MRLLQAAALVLMSAGLAKAEADLSTFRPMPRPVVAEDAPPPLIRPRPRPLVAGAEEASAPEMQPQPKLEMAAASDDLARVHPKPRPNFPVGQPAIAAPTLQPVIATPKRQTKAQPSLKGALCQRADLKGQALPPIRSANTGCNVQDPVLISQVAGVTLSPPATINCEEAVALSNWVTNGLQPAFNNQIVKLVVADSYACRPRNNVRGAQTSVHGLGQAIDISAFVVKTGQGFTVAKNYNAQIRAAQNAGCGTFHTILGPGSDGYHENHIHFDVAHHRDNYCH